jgi:hypothetical protein
MAFGNNNRDGRGDNRREDPDGLRESRVITINRVAKVVKGGRRFSFTALVVIGDGNGKVGLGYGKAKEVPLAIQKGTEEARRNLFEVPMAGSTIIHPVLGQTGGARMMMKPAATGTGTMCCQSRSAPPTTSTLLVRRSRASSPCSVPTSSRLAAVSLRKSASLRVCSTHITSATRSLPLTPLPRRQRPRLK